MDTKKTDSDAFRDDKMSKKSGTGDKNTMFDNSNGKTFSSLKTCIFKGVCWCGLLSFTFDNICD